MAPLPSRTISTSIVLLLLLTLFTGAATAITEKDIFIIKPGGRTEGGQTVLHYDTCYPFDGNRCERTDIGRVPRVCQPYHQVQGDDLIIHYCVDEWQGERVSLVLAEGKPGVDAQGRVYSDCKYSPSSIQRMTGGWHCEDDGVSITDDIDDVVTFVTGLVTGVGFPRAISDSEGGNGADVSVCGSLTCGATGALVYAQPSGDVPFDIESQGCGWFGGTMRIITVGPLTVRNCYATDTSPNMPVPPSVTPTLPTVGDPGPTGYTACPNMGPGRTYGGDARVSGWGVQSCTYVESGTNGADLNIDLSDCPQGTDPRVDVMGRWVLVCTTGVTTTGGTIPTVTPPGMIVGPFDPEHPDIDTTTECPAGGDPAVAWYGMRVAACGGFDYDPWWGPTLRGCTTGTGTRVDTGYGVFGGCAFVDE